MKLRKYINKGGTHVDENGKRHPKNSEIVTVKELDKVFGSNKFEFKGFVDPQDKTSSKKESTSSKDDKQKDVTDDFPEALDGDLQVFKEGNLYRVYDPDEGEDPIDDGDLTSKKKVNAFIEGYFDQE